MHVPQNKPHPLVKEVMMDFLPMPNPLGLYFLTAMHPVEAACFHYQALTFMNDHFHLHKVSIMETTTKYTVEDCCILPLGTSLNRFFLPLLRVQP